MRKQKRKVKYTNEPLGKLVVIPNFLPPPEDLVLRDADETVKITISLDKKSVDFFKEKAKAARTSYQKMIRKLLTHYVMAHAKT